MKGKILLYAAIVAAVSVSCTREAEESGLLNSGIDLEFTATWADVKSTSDAEIDSRTVLQEDGTSIWWTANEEINAFFGSRFAGRFTSTNTSTAATATFQGTLNVLVGTIEEGNDLSEYWAVYPYSAGNTSDGHSVTLTVSSVQTASAGTFADKFFPAVANSKTLELAFYNVCGGARFSVTQEGVTKVIFKSNDGSPMAGKVKVGFAGDNKPQILEFTEPVDSVAINAPEGGFIPGENYFAAMLPQAHVKGMTISLSTQDKKASRTLDNAVTVNRSSFGLLNDVDSGLEYIDDEVQPGTNPDDFIQFEDPIAKYACVEKFDTNGDGEVSYAEAAAVTSLNGLFTDWNTVTLFDEIRFFTGVSSTQNVFTGLKNLKHITIPDNITTLGTFKNCTALTAVVLPAALKTIPAYCFDGCTTLQSVTLPADITSIPNYCFRNCTSLATLAVPSTLTAIWHYAFSGCTVLKGVDLPYGLKTIGNYAFYKCHAITSLDFPASLTTMGYYACSGCTALKTVVLPEDMTSIPDGCFENCTILANITWPQKLTDIKKKAFCGCVVSKEDQLASTMKLPSTVKTIGSQAFLGLRHLILPSTSAISIALDSFCSGYTRLYVPSGMVEMYKLGTNWSSYKYHIYPINDYPVTTYSIPEAVDLGLSVKWASVNLGAYVPEGYGDYFAWGETEPNWDFSMSTYKWCMNGSLYQLIKYCDNSSYGYNGFKDNKTVLDPEDDAASVALGGSWRMPTLSEWKELLDNCSKTWTTLNGVYGRKFTSNKTNYTDKWIFLPAAGYRFDTDLHDVGSDGYYWSSSCVTEYPYNAYILYFLSGDVYSRSTTRYDGFSIRPVCD